MMVDPSIEDSRTFFLGYVDVVARACQILDVGLWSQLLVISNEDELLQSGTDGSRDVCIASLCRLGVEIEQSVIEESDVFASGTSSTTRISRAPPSEHDVSDVVT